MIHAVRGLSRKSEFVVGAVAITFSAMALMILPGQPQTERFEEILSSFTTTLQGRTAGQKQNISLACSLINGKVLLPNQTFSFIGAVGATTPDRGFVKSNAYLDGEIRPAYGGGCCQLSSTVYNAALLANLDIVERSRHIWPVRSVPEGLDAAVNEETLDLKFRNPYDFPIKIRARIRGERLIVSIHAPRKPDETVHVVRRVLESVEAAEVIKPSPALRNGEIKRLRRGRNGSRVVVERVVTGPEDVRREAISDDFYGPRHGVVQVGNPTEAGVRRK